MAHSLLCVSFFYLPDFTAGDWAALTPILKKLNTTLLLKALLNFPPLAFPRSGWKQSDGSLWLCQGVIIVCEKDAQCLLCLFDP